MRVLLSTIGSRGDVQPLVALASQLRGSRGPSVRASRLPRLDRRPRDARHTHRSRAAQDDGLEPTGHAGSLLARAQASTGGRHGRHAIRDHRRGSPRLRHHRGCNSPADRRSVSGREDAHSLRLRRLLPKRSAIAHHAPTPLPALPGQTPPPATGDNRELWARDAERFKSPTRLRAPQLIRGARSTGKRARR